MASGRGPSGNDSHPDYDTSELEHQSEEGAPHPLLVEVNPSEEAAGPSTAVGASVSQNLFEQLLASIENGDSPRSNFIFDHLARMSKAAAIWNNTCDRIFLLSPSNKIKLLEQVAGAGHLHLSEGTRDNVVDDLLLETIASPSMHELLMHSPKGANTSLQRLNKLLVERKAEGIQKKKKDKNVNVAFYGLLSHFKQCLFRFMDDLVSQSKLPHIASFIEEGKRTADSSNFFPFEARALLRIFEFCPRGRPIQLPASNLATTFHHRRDGTKIRGAELVKILYKLDEYVGDWVSKQKAARNRIRVTLIKHEWVADVTHRPAGSPQM